MSGSVLSVAAAYYKYALITSITQTPLFLAARGTAPLCMYRTPARRCIPGYPAAIPGPEAILEL